MMRIIARHALLATVEDPERFCTWVAEVALAEGAEGWVARSGDAVEVWFEGSAPVVEAMLDWCSATHGVVRSEMAMSEQRPVLRGGFDILSAPPER